MKKILFLGIIFSLLYTISVTSCKHLPDEISPKITDTTKNDTTNNGGGGGNNKRPCSPDSVYYDRDIQPIFNSNCSGNGCHFGSNPAKGILLTTYENAVATGRIKKFDAENSDMYECITGKDELMPPTGKMSQTNIDLIKKWIDQGAKKLVCDDMILCDTAIVTYSGSVKPILDQNCNSCHNNQLPKLNTYLLLKNVVDNGKLHKAINHLTGAVPMPSSTVKLENCNIRKIEIWIKNGAPNN